MLKYIAKRILMMIPVILGISFIIFFSMNLTPGDAAISLAGDSATPEAIQAIREELGLNDPLIVRYVRYIWDMLHGDFGNSYNNGQPVVNEIKARFPYTFRLALFSTAFACLLGIPIGILSAVKQYSILDTGVTGIALVLTSLPGFFFGLILILIFSLKLGWLPMIGMDSVLEHIMPCIAAGTGTFASMVRMTRSTMLEVIRQDYVRTARAKGVPERKVIFKHSLKNAMLPVVTAIGLQLGLAMGGSIAIEQLFSIPGLGQLTITAIRQKDVPVAMARIIMTAVLISVANLVVDILYYFIDPRLKAQLSKRKKAAA